MEKTTKSKVWDMLIFVVFIVFGLGASIGLGFFLIIISAIDYHAAPNLSWLEHIMYCLPGGFIAGLLGGWVERKLAKSTWGTLGLLLGTIFLSILLSLFSWDWLLEILSRW